MKRDFDLIVYGATGYTGGLIAEYLATAYRGEDAPSWAMAGRSIDKLQKVCAEIGAPDDLPLLKADAAEPASLRAMCERAAVIITTVGPYQRYGTELVAACAAAGTGYVDLCGEPAWMRRMIDIHHEEAKRSGARIVFSCGYDSLPFELGVFCAQEEAKKSLGATVPRVKGRVRKMVGTFSGGTAASMRAIVEATMKDLSLVSSLRDPFILTPGFDGPKQPLGNRPLFDQDLQSWTAPFVMANINTRNVHRSNMLLGFPYGKEFVYDEMVVTGPGEQGEEMARKVMAANNKLSGADVPKPGEGPSKAEREAGHYDLLFVAIAPDGKQARAVVKGDRDPGYGSTSKMIAECAICLLRDGADVAPGIWTPGAAMGHKLIKRLEDNAGIKFSVEK